MPHGRASAMARVALVAFSFLALSSASAHASIAYGSVNNFDTVNDTGVPAYGFEIELDDIQSVDITYTFDWNHYGTPTITEDGTSTPGHTNVFVRYAAVNTNGGWSAYTAVPSGPIAPTQGHQFTNPSVNFGGEHFGVGYRRPASTVKYNWLIDNGSGALVHGPPVNVATPTFTYIPPAGGAPAQVQAAIVPPPPPVLPATEFGSAGWVKEIRTTSHSNNEVKIGDLISPDPDYPEIKDWRNGEPDEVEVEWQILQIDYMSANGGANGQLVGAPESLNQGDEIVTRRYEFYEYVGPLDPDTGEAMAQAVGPDGIHGATTNADLVVVGRYLGAQMSAYAAAPQLGLIDHLPDGVLNTPYATRSVVIAADTNFTVTTSGALPDGMAFDPPTGQVYGTPWTNGVFTFHVEASATNSPVHAKTYIFTIANAGEVLPPHSAVDTSASPLNGGTTSGDGVYTNGTMATVTATPNPGYGFINWMENGSAVSSSASYLFTNNVNRSLVATFAPAPSLSLTASAANTWLIAWPTNFSGFVLQQNSDLSSTNWLSTTNVVNVSGTNNQAAIPTSADRLFFRLRHP